MLLHKLEYAGFILLACGAAVSMSAQAAGALLAVGAWLVALFFARRGLPPRGRPATRELVLLAFVGLLLASTAVSLDRALSVKRLTVLLGEVACYFAAASFPWDRRRALAFTDCLAAFAALEGALALAQYRTGAAWLGFGTTMPVRRFGPAAGTWDYYNSLGGILAMIAPLAWFRAATIGGWPRKALFAALAAFATAGVLVSSSRGSVIGLSAGLLVALFFERKMLAVVPVLLVIAGLLLVPMTSRRFASLNPGDAHRRAMWSVSLKMIRERPLLGSGIDTFSARYRGEAGQYPEREGLTFFHPHNIYLGIGAECGVPCLALFLAFLALWPVPLARAYRLACDPALRAVLLGCAAAAVSVLAHGLVDFTLRGGTVYLFWTALGILGSGLFKDEGKPS